jgi:hypothetical protein
MGVIKKKNKNISDEVLTKTKEGTRKSERNLKFLGDKFFK